MKKTILILAMLVTLTSCFTTKTNVGQYKESTGNTYVYSKGKQVWLFWNLVPLGRTKTSTPSNGSCQVITRFNLIDVLISGITCGIISTETIKIKAKREETKK